MYFFVSVTVAALLYLLARQAKKEVRPVAGWYQLRLSKVYLFAGLAVLAVGGVFLAMPLLAEEYSPEILTVSGLLFGGSTALGGWLYLCYRNHQVLFDAEQASTTSPFGQQTSMRWAEVVSAAYQPVVGQVVLRDATGRTLRASTHLVGFTAFVGEVVRQQAHYRFTYQPPVPASITG